MKIGICDDERAVQDDLRRRIENICEGTGISAETVCFASGAELLAADESADAAPDILFLDIRMPGEDGMDVARTLRTLRPDMVLIFVTALSEYVYDAFDVGAFHYLVKPIRDEKLREVLTKAAAMVAETEQMQGGGPDACDGKTVHRAPKRSLLVKRGGVSTRVFMDDIVYAEVFNRKVTLHTADGDIEYYGRLTDLSEKAGSGFYRTHRAYLVNFRYVEKYTATEVCLGAGRTVPIAKKQFAGFVRCYMRYLGGQKDG